MTDKVKGLVVSFDADIREDDCQRITEAILMIKGVSEVNQSIATPDDWMNRSRIKSEIKEKLLEIVL